jgi:hypothetical protein
VSTTSVRIVQGLAPRIEQKLSVGDHRIEAYINRDEAAECTGLDSTSILSTYYARQLAEVGIVVRTTKGEFGLVETASGTHRGQATGWALDWDAYTPGDIPELELETEEYLVDVDMQAALAGLAPTTSDWAKEAEAHRLVLALIHHAGLRRVKLTSALAARVLGKSRITGWRLLKRLEKLGFLVDGWLDISALLVDATAVMPHPAHEEAVERRRTVHWSVFTREGWDVRQMVRQAEKSYPELAVAGVLPEYAALFTAKRYSFSRTLQYFRRFMEAPDATGRGVTAADF